MARKKKEAAQPQPELVEDDVTRETQVDEEIVAEAEEEGDLRKGSVVKIGYKLAYRARAKERGDSGKAAKRSKWDWLAQRMAEAVLKEKAKLDVDALLAFLDENGVDHTRWTNRSPGWEGRLRMTGGLALRKIVAERGTLIVNGTEMAVPERDLELLAAKYA